MLTVVLCNYVRRKGRREDARSVSLVVVEGLQLGRKIQGFEWFHGVFSTSKNNFAPLAAKYLNFSSRPSDAKEQEALKQLLSLMPSQRSIAASNPFLEYVGIVCLVPDRHRMY